MATLAQLQTLRDNNLGDTFPSSPSTPLGDPICLRNTFNAILEELFPPVIHDFKTNTIFNLVVFSPSSGIELDIKVSKSGNKVFLNGSFTNKTGSSLYSGYALVAIVNSLYGQKTGLDQVIPVIKRNGNTDLNQTTPLFITGNNIITSNSVGNNETLIFNATYFTND